MNEASPLTDVKTLRQQARRQIEDGAVTPGYRADRALVLQMLNTALATELVCVLRYRRHHFMARGLASQSIADEFLTHSNEEQGHADQRVDPLGQQDRVDDVGVIDVIDDHRPAFSGNAPGETLSHRDLPPCCHRLLQPDDCLYLQGLSGLIKQQHGGSIYL